MNKNECSIAYWLSPEEVQKLIKALQESRGTARLVITGKTGIKNVYYIDGEIVFERKLK